MEGSCLWANFSIMMERTPESGRCHSVYSVGQIHSLYFYSMYSVIWKFVYSVCAWFVCMYLGKGQTKLFIFLKCKLIASTKRELFIYSLFKGLVHNICSYHGSYRKGKRYIFTAGLRHSVVEMHIPPGSSYYTYLQKSKRYQRHVFLQEMPGKEYFINLIQKDTSKKFKAFAS